MSDPIDFWFDFSSPYGYLMSERIDDLAARFGRTVRFLGIPYRRPTRFPLPTQNAARAYYWLHGEDCALARRFAHAVYRALFVDDRDISAPETVLEIGTKLGVDRGRLESRSGSRTKSMQQ